MPTRKLDSSSLAEALAADLLRRCHDRTLKWAYHPQSNSVGRVVAEHVLASLLSFPGAIERALKQGRLAATFGSSVHSGRRKKTFDLVVGEPEAIVQWTAPAPGELLSGVISKPLLLVEVKACMTAHGKAWPRLTSELLSSLEIADGLRPRPALLGVLVVNFASRFTSPKNLPGPNLHAPGDAKRVLDHVFEAVPVGGRLGYDALIVVPIDFDNERISRVHELAKHRGSSESDAYQIVDRLVSDLLPK